MISAVDALGHAEQPINVNIKDSNSELDDSLYWYRNYCPEPTTVRRTERHQLAGFEQFSAVRCTIRTGFLFIGGQFSRHVAITRVFRDILARDNAYARRNRRMRFDRLLFRLPRDK